MNNQLCLITVKEAAEIARVSEFTVYRWVDEGFCPHIRLGGHPVRASNGRKRNRCIRIPRDKFLSWLLRDSVEGRKRRSNVNQYV